MSGMKSWSTTPANNVLANTGFTMDEGQAPSTLNDSIRQAMADIRTEWAQGANIASAATVDLSTATGGYVHITGVVTITSFGTVSAGIRRRITFDGALTLTHNAASLILPTGGNITTVAGDTCEAMSEGSGNWRVLWYAGKNVQATNVTASTSVVTPLVAAPAGTSLSLASNGATSHWVISGTTADLTPGVAQDNSLSFGSAALRIKQAFTPIIDTGTTGSGALKTNNGSTQVTWDNNGAIAIGGRASPASGAGVAFPAVQSASTDVNTIDDYQEKSFTPDITFGGGSTGITYSGRSGFYVKVGSLIFYRGNFVLTSKGSSTGTAKISLPLTDASSGGIALGPVIWASMTSTLVNMVLESDNFAATATFYGATAATATLSALTDTAFSNTSSVDFSLCYKASA